MAGEIVHLEIPSRSFERSASFYAKLFGWRTDGQQVGGHLRFEVPGAAPSTTGSLVRSALAQATGPLPFIAVDDVDQTLAEAERQGGRVLARRLPLAGHSQYGLLADVDGNVIAVVAGSAGNEKAASPEARKAKDEAPNTSSTEKTPPAAAGKKPMAKKAAAAPPTRATKPAAKPGAARKR
jgi:predicted enzyme related to lactoylglutathione lyase